MRIKIWEYTIEEATTVLGCTEEDLHEWYGSNCKKLYLAERRDGNWSAMLGIQYEDGSYGVCGLRRDRNNITYEDMIETLNHGF